MVMVRIRNIPLQERATAKAVPFRHSPFIKAMAKVVILY
jgi:hypothetical protein